MMLPKKTLIAVAAIICTIVLAYLARVAIVKSISQEELAFYQAKITCLDFHLTTDLALAVSRLCLQTPQADITIDDIAIKFQLASEQKIKRIDIASVSITGTASLFSEFNNRRQKSDDITPTMQLQSYLKTLAQLDLPLDINVKKIRYSPYTLANDSSKNMTGGASYFGDFSAIENTIKLSLKDRQNSVFLTANFSTNKQQNEQFTVEFTGQLMPLQVFLFAHDLPLSAVMSDTVDTIKTKGELHSVLTYQAGQLTLDSQLTDLSLAASQGVKASGPFEISGALNIHGQVNLNNTPQALNSNTELAVEFLQTNTLQLQFSHQRLIDYLTKNSHSPAVITLLKDNPLARLTVSPKGKLAYNHYNQQLSLSSIVIEAKSAQHEHQLILDNITLNLKHYLTDDIAHAPAIAHRNSAKDVSRIDNIGSQKQVTAKPPTQNSQYAQLDFTLDSLLVLSALNNFSHSPLVLKLQGSISQNVAQTTLHLNENSSFISKNIAVSTKQQTGEKKLFSIKQLATQVQGDVQIKNPTLVQNSQQIPIDQSIKLNLKLNSQAKKLQVEEVININILAVNTTVKGDLNNIDINALVRADSVPLGSLALLGTLEKANITLTANELPLTDLLSLNVKLPTEIDLVEGTLSYSVKGQVTNLTGFQNTPFAMSVAMTSVSGDIAGIWIRELNWQQNFNYFAGELTSQHSSEKSTEKNLTIALIDTPTPISKFSINTAWHYQKDVKISATKLKADILGGSFSIPKIQWPLEHGHSVDVQLTSIDLEQVLALDKKQGIVVTGKISGQMPISYDGEKYTMEKGELHNVSNGLIQVMNNPAVVELKANNSQLKLAFDALQNLHYHQLSSDVSMADDGYMLLETVIKGRNPDINNDVNLNLNLSYDLLGLLESMAITEQFEERIIKGLQKN